ncbi:Glycerol uptake facilitator protein [compost metagenome]
MYQARDLGPKTFAWFAGWGEMAFTGGKNIPYFVVPLFAPIVGALLGAFGYRKLIGRNLPCDVCETEEQDTTASTTQHKASL